MEERLQLQCQSCYSRCGLVAMVNALGYALRDLWLIFQLVVLHSELLASLAPSMDVKVAVSSLLVSVLLFGWLHSRSSGDPQPLLFVVAPVPDVSEAHRGSGFVIGIGSRRFL